MRSMELAELSEAVKQAIIQMAGSGVSLEKILETLESKGIKVSLEDAVNVILESGKDVGDAIDIEDTVGVMKWLIKNQVKRVNKYFGIESISPLPLPETTNNIKILAELVIKYSEMSKGSVGVKDLKKSIFGGGIEKG